MTLRLSMFERFLMLSRIVDDIPAKGGGEAIRAMSTACMTTIRSMRGQVDDASARFAIDHAREVLLTATKSSGAGNHRGKSEQDVGTPWEFIHAVEARFGPIVFDLACTTANAKAPAGYYFDQGVDALTRPWAEEHPAGNLWLNPRFSNVAPWAAKCAAEALERDGCIFMLTPASVSTEWFAEHVDMKALVLPLRPRLTFEGNEDPFPKDLILSVYSRSLSGFETWRWK